MLRRLVLATLSLAVLCLVAFTFVQPAVGGPSPTAEERPAVTVLDGPTFDALSAASGEGFTPVTGEAAAGILVCFPWYDVGCNVEGRCYNECADKTLRVRACQICSSSGCSFSHYETSCSQYFCS